MSTGVEVVERVYDAINRADFDAAVACLSQDFELDFSNSRGPMSGIYRGRDGGLEFLTSFSEPWASLHFAVEEAIELEDGRVLVVLTVRGQGHESGINVAATGAAIWTLKNGEVTGVVGYQSKTEALEAAVS